MNSSKFRLLGLLLLSVVLAVACSPSLNTDIEPSSKAKLDQNELTENNPEQTVNNDSSQAAGSNVSSTKNEVGERAIIDSSNDSASSDLSNDNDDGQEVNSMADSIAEFSGIVVSMGDQTWTIGDVQVTVTPETAIEDGIEIGDMVDVEALLTDDESLVALEIELVDEDDEDEDQDQDEDDNGDDYEQENDDDEDDDDDDD
jgi:hypothetical protein